MKKHVILSSYVDDNRSKELVELETGKTVWKIDNPFNAEMDWMSVKNDELFFVTHEGMMKYSLLDGSILAKCKFDKSEFGEPVDPGANPPKLSEKIMGKKDTPKPLESTENKELLPVVKDGYVFVQASKRLVIYDLYTFNELYSSDILFDSCDVVNSYVYLKNQDGIAKLELKQ